MAPVQFEGLNLRVSDALPRDAVMGIARLRPQDMAKIGVRTGDFVKITGKRQTVARDMPAHPEDRGTISLRIDGVTRENAQVGLGEKVRVQKTECDSAVAVT